MVLASTLRMTVILTIFGSAASSLADTAGISDKLANFPPRLSIRVGDPVQSQCGEPDCRSVTPKISCKQEELDAPLRCEMRFDAIQVAKSSYWYTRRSCQFYPGGGRRTPQEIEACRAQKALEGPPQRYCRDQQRRGPLPCGPNQ